jgi:hypothetical protein
VAGWKIATTMKHYARLLDAWRAREITRRYRRTIGHKAVKRHGVTKVALADREAACLKGPVVNGLLTSRVTCLRTLKTSGRRAQAATAGTF